MIQPAAIKRIDKIVSNVLDTVAIVKYIGDIVNEISPSAAAP